MGTGTERRSLPVAAVQHLELEVLDQHDFVPAIAIDVVNLKRESLVSSALRGSGLPNGANPFGCLDRVAAAAEE